MKSESNSLPDRDFGVLISHVAASGWGRTQEPKDETARKETQELLSHNDVDYRASDDENMTFYAPGNDTNRVEPPASLATGTGIMDEQLQAFRLPRPQDELSES